MTKLTALSILVGLSLFLTPIMTAADISPEYGNVPSGYELYIEDYADLLTSDQESALMEIMKPITEYGNVAFLSIAENPYSSTERYVENFYKEHWGRESGTILIIDMDERYIWIHSDGDIYRTITSSYATTITDNVYSYASDEDYYTCAKIAFTQIHTLLEGRWIAQPMKWISNAFLAVAIALFINYFVALHASRARKATTGQLLGSTYHNINITNARANFTKQTKHYSPQSSGGGSGRSGGGGGGRSGGGGGHRF